MQWAEGMAYGAAHVEGLYTVPAGSGTQFTDGADVAEALYLRAFKFYCTQQYAAQYPFQSSWSSAPTTCREFLRTAQAVNVLGRSFDTYSITMFAFGNPANNWWRDAGYADNPRLLVEYNEIYDAARHLLATYNGKGKTFVIQNWEGDWALMDAFDPTTYVRPKLPDYYLAFHSARQRAVRDARRDTPSDCRVLYAIEVNRVLDVDDNPGRRRLLTDVIGRLNPDVVSYSAYDSTIATYGYGADPADWEHTCEVQFTRALRIIKQWAPDALIQIGEFGFEEKLIAAWRPDYDVRRMIRTVARIAKREGCFALYYWEVFDNEYDATFGVKGYYLAKPDGSTSLAGAEMSALATGASLDVVDPRLAWQSRVRRQGVSVPFVTEATLDLGGNRYKLYTAARRVIDPSVPLTVYDGATPVKPVAVDYLFGIVTLAGAPAGAVSVSGSYLTTTAVAEVRSFEMHASADMVANNRHDSAPGARRLPGVREMRAQVEAIDEAPIAVGDEVLIEVYPGGATEVFRAWCIVTEVANGAKVDEVNAVRYDLVSSTRGEFAARAFGWGYP